MNGYEFDWHSFVSANGMGYEDQQAVHTSQVSIILRNYCPEPGSCPTNAPAQMHPATDESYQAGHSSSSTRIQGGSVGGHYGVYDSHSGPAYQILISIPAAQSNHHSLDAATVQDTPTADVQPNAQQQLTWQPKRRKQNPLERPRTHHSKEQSDDGRVHDVTDEPEDIIVRPLGLATMVGSQPVVYFEVKNDRPFLLRPSQQRVQANHPQDLHQSRELQTR